MEVQHRHHLLKLHRDFGASATSIQDRQLSNAVVVGVNRAVVNRWVHEQVDPNAETVAEIVIALKSLNPDAAEMFIQQYLGDLIREEPIEGE